jgi:hypothetical protein
MIQHALDDGLAVGAEISVGSWRTNPVEEPDEKAEFLYYR